MLRRRLYLQIYLTIIASLVLVVVLTAVLWNVFGREGLNCEALNVAGRLIYLTLPPAEASAVQQRRALDRLRREIKADVTLFDRRRALVAASGRVGPAPEAHWQHHGWHRVRGTPAWGYRMPDGRWLVVDLGRRGPHAPLLNLALLLGSVALGVGLGAYPFVRRLTRRLERLQSGVERVGRGDLSARVEVTGRDEVASLASSFNEAAAKVEKLISAHRMLLANASHELRTPLSRIRLGLEMLKDGGDPARREALQQDIAELDALIDEILLMSRLDAGSHAELGEQVDLVALAAEECARYDDCHLTGTAPLIWADPRLLRRLIRNLLENARIHGAPPIGVAIAHSKAAVTLRVSDGGGGIPEADREKVFHPFYRAPGRQNVKGHGLGLPLVRQIAAAHGGTAEAVDSAIRVTLPIRTPGPEGSAGQDPR